MGSIRQGAGVVAGYFKGSPGEIGSFPTIRRRIFAPTVKKQPMTALRGPGECGPVTRIASPASAGTRSRPGFWMATSGAGIGWIKPRRTTTSTAPIQSAPAPITASPAAVETDNSMRRAP